MTMLYYNNFLALLALFTSAVCLQQHTVFATHETQPRLFSSWFSGGGTNPKSDQFLPATLQVLEHTASQVNGTWGDDRGLPLIAEEIEPLPGLLRLTVLRNSLLSEAKAANLENFDGFTPEVSNQLETTSKSPLPEQLATVIEFTFDSGELESVEQKRGKALRLLATEVMNELRDKKSQLSNVLIQFESLKYTS